MYFTRDGAKEIHYLIDRKNEYYYVPQLHFPMPGDPTFHAFHTETIIDGELVLDTVAPGKLVLKYLVFDCLIIDKKSVMDRTLDRRLAVRSVTCAGNGGACGGDDGGGLIRIVLQRIRLHPLPSSLQSLPAGSRILPIPVGTPGHRHIASVTANTAVDLSSRRWSSPTP